MNSDLKQHYEDTRELMIKVHPHFQGVHSFTMMMVLADLIAQWLLSHPHDDRGRVLYALADTTLDRANQLMENEEKETRH